MSTAVFERLRTRAHKPRMMTLSNFLVGCKEHSEYYATAAQRLLKAMGEPVTINSAEVPRLGRVFQNRKVQTFPAFEDFYGIEQAVESLYNTLKSASQGLEENKQIIYFLGPVGSAKSSLAERLKELMEREKIYVLAVPSKDESGKIIPDSFELSPLYESPLGLFSKEDGPELESEYGIPKRLLDGICSPWAVKRLMEMDGDVTQFWVAEMFPSRLREIGIAKTEPGDDNNQDISALVGKVDVRKLEDFAINDADAYSYSGALCKASQGLMEFVEMFKAPIKTLHPLLTATQERNFMGTEAIGAMPFRGLIIAHSNEAEWDKFSKDKKNEAFLDRVRLIRVKYNLRLEEEQSIYEKLMSGSSLAGLPTTPFTLELLGRVVIASRLEKTNKCKLAEKVLIYDGRDLRDEIPMAPTLYDLQNEVGIKEGMEGISTRTAFKVLSRAANLGDEIGLDPIELLQVLKQELRDLGTQPDAISFADEQAKGWLMKQLGDMIREALLEDYDEFAQVRFQRYIEHCEAWLNPDVGAIQDPDTGQMLQKPDLEKKLLEIEGPAKIDNAKDFRSEVVQWVLRYKLQHENTMPKWDEYRPMKNVIKHLVVKQTQDLLPLIQFGPKRDSELDEKHQQFLVRMQKRGFTSKQTRRVVAWYLQMNVTS